MRIHISISIYSILLIGLLLQSCSKDEAFEVSTEELKNGKNGGHNDSDGSIGKLDNDLIVDWTDLFLELDRYVYGMRPNATARAIAYINLATYETAVPGMRSKKSTKNSLDGLEINSTDLSRNINYKIALNSCYADVLDHFLLNLADDKRNRISALEEKIEDRYSKKISDKSLTESREWGKYVAEQIIAYSQTDVAAEEQILEPQPTSYEPPVGDGNWTYSADPERALFPYWESVRTFVISPKETTTIAPLEYSENTDSEYYAQMKQVYEVNNKAKEQQNDQLWIAEFWSDDVEGLMMSPPARQFSIANQLVKKFDLNMEETLTLFVKLGFSLNDGAVATWKYKYEYMVMRPSVYIHDFIDPDFQTNLYKFIYWPNPGFPGYPSGHSCFASAAAGVFIDYFGNEVNFTDKTHEGRTEFLGAARQFSTMEEMARENAFSRIPLGVHVSMDCEEGLRLGYEISDAINELDLEKDAT